MLVSLVPYVDVRMYVRILKWHVVIIMIQLNMAAGICGILPTTAVRRSKSQKSGIIVQHHNGGYANLHVHGAFTHKGSIHQNFQHKTTHSGALLVSMCSNITY